MAKKILTQDDLDKNPVFVEWGYKVGDEVEVPSQETNSDEEVDPGGGGNHPKKPGNP